MNPNKTVNRPGSLPVSSCLIGSLPNAGDHADPGAALPTNNTGSPGKDSSIDGYSHECRSRLARSALRIAEYAATTAALILMFICPGYAADQGQSTFPVGGDGGVRFSSPCERYEYLVGLRLRMGDDIDAIGAICGEYLPDGSRGRITNKDFFGGGGGAPDQFICPPDNPFVRQLYVNAEGRETIVLNDLIVFCGPMTGPLPMPQEITNKAFHAPWSDTNGGFFQIQSAMRRNKIFECPNNMMLTGIHGRSGQVIDALGVICDKITAAPPPIKTLGKRPAPPPTLAEPGTSGTATRAHTVSQRESATRDSRQKQMADYQEAAQDAKDAANSGAMDAVAPMFGADGGTSSGDATAIKAENHALDKRLSAMEANQIICRGGDKRERFAIARYGSAADGSEMHIMYFRPANGLKPGRCKFSNDDWMSQRTEIILFKAAKEGAESAETLGEFLSDPSHYWRFLVRKNSDNGFFESSQHGRWTPSSTDADAAKLQSVSQASGDIPSSLFDMDDRAIIIVGGREALASEIKQDLRTGLQRLSGSTQTLSLTRPTSATLIPATSSITDAQAASASLPASAMLTPATSSITNAQAASASISRASATSQLASTPIAGTSNQPAAQRAAGFEMDCERPEPRIHAVQGRISPGVPFKLDGACFGQRGQVELRGDFGSRGDVLTLSASRWHENTIEFITPTLSGVRDQVVVVAITRADGRRSLDRAVPFAAERRTVPVPQQNWTPTAAPDRTAIATEAGGGPGSAPGVLRNTDGTIASPQQFNLNSSVRVSEDCALQDVNVTARSGQIVSLEGWNQPGPANAGSVIVHGIPTCATKIAQYDFIVYGETEVRQVCSLAVDLTATASCPVGIAP